MSTNAVGMMQAVVDAHGDRQVGRREALALHLSGLAGVRWELADEFTRDHWRMCASEVVSFVESS